MSDTRIGLVTCASMHEQLKECVASFEGSFKIYPIVPPCTFNLKGELIRNTIDKSIAENYITILVFGICHPQMLEIIAEHSDTVVRLRGSNCYEIILGEQKYKEFHDKGYLILTKLFFTNFKKDLLAGYEPITKNGSIVLAKTVKKILYLRFGNDRLEKKIIDDFASILNLDYDIFSVDIGNLKKLVEDALTVAPRVKAMDLIDIISEDHDKKEIRVILENIGEIIYKIDIHTRKFTFISPQVKNILGYTPLEFMDIMNGYIQVLLYHEDDAKRIIKKRYNYLIDCLNKGVQEPYEDIFRMKHKNGNILWVLESIYPNYSSKGSIMSFVGKIEDITNRKKAEEKLKESENKLKKLNLELELIIEEKIKEIKGSEEEYRDAYNLINFYKDLFAHDMKNILQNIISSVEFYSIFRDNPKKLKEFEDVVELVKKQANRGSLLINNVIKLTDLSEKRDKLRPIEIYGALKESVENAISGFQERNVNIKIDGLLKEMKIRGNELLIDIFDNILNNAVKYNDNDIEVKIDVIISKVQKGRMKYLKFEFKDYGIGIIDDKKEKLFKRLFTNDISKRGMGMGLSLVKKIVDKYGGKIWVEDRIKEDYRKGSNFILLLKEA